MPDQPLITSASTATFAGASTLVLAISAAIRKLTGRNWTIIPFVISLAVAFAVAVAQNTLSTPLDYLVTVGNACMLFCAALGGNEFAVDKASPKPAGMLAKQMGRPMPLLQSWFN